MKHFWTPEITWLVLLSLVAACGGSEIEKDPAKKPVVTVDAGDVGVDRGPDLGEADAGPDVGPQYVCPYEGEQICGGKCVDVTISMDHCGRCDNACVRGVMTCDGTDCVCLSGRTMCGGQCYDTQTHRTHCGDCDNSCASSQACVDGACVEISDRPEVLGVLAATNDARAQQQDCGTHGIKNPADGVQLNEQLNEAAQIHAEDMASGSFLSHTGSDGSSPSERAARAGYNGATGENVARGYESAAAVVQGWIDSDGHCNNLMNPSFDEMGVGYARSPTSGEEFWVQLFGWR